MTEPLTIIYLIFITLKFHENFQDQWARLWQAVFLTIISHTGPTQLHQVSLSLFGEPDHPIYPSLNPQQLYMSLKRSSLNNGAGSWCWSTATALLAMRWAKTCCTGTEPRKDTWVSRFSFNWLSCNARSSGVGKSSLLILSARLRNCARIPPKGVCGHYCHSLHLLHVRSDTPIWDRVLRLLLDIAQGTLYLHHLQIIHGDLKVQFATFFLEQACSFVMRVMFIC